MKKLLVVIFTLVLCLTFVNAEESNFLIKDVKVVKSSDGVVLNDKNNVNAIFNDLNQQIKYEATIENKSDKKLYLNFIEVENSSEKFIEYKLDTKSENKVLEPNSSSKINFYVNTLEIEGAGRNLIDDVKINFMISDKIFNPNTFSNIIELIVLLVILGFVTYFFKRNKRVQTMILIIGISIIGIEYVYANDYIKVLLPGNIQYISQNNIIASGTTLNGKQADYTNSKEVWAYYDKVKNVEVKSLINEPKDYYKKFDLTENKTGRVMAYLVENNDKDTPYDLKIMSKGVVIANKDSSFMFSFPKTEKVEGLTNVDFNNTESMQGMFIGNEKVEELEVSAIPLDNVKDTSYMFYENKNLDVTIKDFNTDHIENIEDITYMTQNYLYDIVKKNAKSDKDIDYTKEDTATNHVFYKTENTEKPIYYYRGSVQDNNVKFGGFCWHIVRTTETGGIKLLYNGTPDENGKCISKNPNATLAGDAKFSASQGHLGAAGYMYGERIPFKNIRLSSKTEEIKYGNDVVYDKETNMYTLVDTVSTSNWENDMEEIIKKHHYSCFNESGQCSKVNYIIEADLGNYVEMQLGDKIEDIILKANKNTNDSNAKKVIDTWYQNNLISYESNLEDTIWCNDRTIATGTLVGKDHDPNDTPYEIRYTAGERIIHEYVTGQKIKDIVLTCPNKNDSFTVDEKNGNGALTYPIALLTVDELALIGGSINDSNVYAYNEKCWWVMTSESISSNWVYGFRAYRGVIHAVNINVTGSTYLRPSISLKPGTQFSKGTGSHDNPYIIEGIEQ